MARTVILGRGGHALVLSSFVIGEWIGPDYLVPTDAEVVIGIGDRDGRKMLYLEHRDQVRNAIAPSALIQSHSYGPGFQAMHGAIVQFGCEIGQNVLVNTGAQIDHDCKIGNHCVIAPGAILCGNVTLGEACFVGAGSIIVEGVTLEAETFVPAGSLVVGQDDIRRPRRVVQDDGMPPLEVGSDGPEYFYPESIEHSIG